MLKESFSISFNSDFICPLILKKFCRVNVDVTNQSASDYKQKAVTGVNISPYFLDAHQVKGFGFLWYLGKGFEMPSETVLIFRGILVKMPKKCIL